MPVSFHLPQFLIIPINPAASQPATTITSITVAPSAGKAGHEVSISINHLTSINFVAIVLDAEASFVMTNSLAKF